MSSQPAVPDKGNLRASDADRERVAEILREAAGDGRVSMEELDERLDAVYAAKTYAELEPITRDLPDPGTPNMPARATAPAGDPARFGGVPTSHTAVAILGGFSRRGDWVVPKQFTAVAILVGGEVDLREARFSEPVVTLNVVAIMGGVEITVPEDATVRVTGIGIMGGFDHGSSGSGASGGPTIVINGVAIMGGVDVKRKKPKKSRPEAELDAGRDYREVRLEARRERLEARREYREARRDHMHHRRDSRRADELD
jgi:hypothetical protein